MWELYTLWVLVPVVLATRLVSAAVCRGPRLSCSAPVRRGCVAVACWRALGQCTRGWCAAGSQRAVLSSRTLAAGAPCRAVSLVAAGVGRHRRRRFAAVLGADSFQRTAPCGG
jgi:hypothetical protein